MEIWWHQGFWNWIVSLGSRSLKFHHKSPFKFHKYPSTQSNVNPQPPNHPKRCVHIRYWKYILHLWSHQCGASSSGWMSFVKSCSSLNTFSWTSAASVYLQVIYPLDHKMQSTKRLRNMSCFTSLLKELLRVCSVICTCYSHECYRIPFA